MGSDSLPQFSKPTSQLKLAGTRCQREEDREGQPPGVELTAVATRTRATATAVGSRRATPMPTAPPTTTMEVDTASTPRPLREPSLQAARPTRPTPTTTVGPPRPSISKQKRHGRINDMDTDHQKMDQGKKTINFKIVPHFY